MGSRRDRGSAPHPPRMSAGHAGAAPGVRAHVFAGGRRADGLRMATWNVRGLGDLKKLLRFAAEWRVLGLDIIFLQEVLISAGDGERKDLVVKALGEQGFGIEWELKPRAQAGVAIVYSLRAVSSGQLQAVRMERVDMPGRNESGRLLVVKVVWRGHRLLLANVYLPSGGGEAARLREEMLTDLRLVLQKALPAGYQLILGGDFNFVEDASIDRRPARAVSYDDQRSVATMQPLRAALQLVDVHRRLRPGCPGHTYFWTSSASRLDRFYIPEQLVASALSCQVAAVGGSDHLPVVLTLRPAAPARIGPGLPRARLSFWKDQQLRDAFHAFLLVETMAAPVQGPHLPQQAADLALLNWWPGFKERLRGKAMLLDREQRALLRAADAGAVAAKRQLAKALEALDEATGPAPGGPDQLLLAVRAAKVAYSEARGALDRKAADTVAAKYLREGERPSPAMTAAVSAPRAQRGVAAVAGPNGSLITNGQQLAEAFGRSYALVSAAREVEGAAERAVLDKVEEHAVRFPPEAAKAAGRPEVSLAEVRTAALAMAPGKAPGPDGLPPEIWRKGGEPLQKVLAAVLSAVGRLMRSPDGFLDGCVTPILKPFLEGTAVSHYRPITLLNTDYRLLAKVLVARVAPLLAAAVGPEQTAFLKGRRIGDNILFLQLLPQVLRRNAATGVGPASAGIAFLDFQKAYDTVSRRFLLEVMRAVGAGEELCNWVQLILGSTSSSAAVNGFVSERFSYAAGVRQGCPVAPLLYLFVAWALSCWLRDQPGLGVEVEPGERRPLVQFADDGQVIVAPWSEEAVESLVEAMGVFGRASGQRLNTGKSRLLVMGMEPDWVAPAEVAGIPVVRQAAALGVVFTAEGEPTSDPEIEEYAAAWQEQLLQVKRCYTRVAEKGHLSVFGRSHAAACYGVGRLLHRAEFSSVPEAVTAQLRRWTADLVDRGGLEGLQRPPPGVRSGLLVGRMARGGFGALPWRQHIHARRAMHARRFIQLMLGPPAQRPLWVGMAAQLLGGTFPGVPPAWAMVAAAREEQGGEGVPSGPLLRMVEGLRALGVMSLGEGAMPPAPQEAEAAAALQEMQWVVQPLGPDQPGRPTAGRMASKPVSLLGDVNPLTVRAGTALQLRGIFQEQRDCRRAFVEAAGSVGEDQLRDLVDLEATMVDISRWRFLRNSHKEVWWRLAMNGVAGAGSPPRTCQCGQWHRDEWGMACSDLAVAAWRKHAFWDCPVAQHVVRRVVWPVLEANATCPEAATKRHFWLMQLPRGRYGNSVDMHLEVWRAICLAALTAMNAGRLAMRGKGTGDQVCSAGRLRAEKKFWDELIWMAGPGAEPPASWEDVGADHRILRVVGSGADRRVRFAPPEVVG